jgi:hypothetical protein
MIGDGIECSGRDDDIVIGSAGRLDADGGHGVRMPGSFGKIGELSIIGWGRVEPGRGAGNVGEQEGPRGTGP